MLKLPVEWTERPVRIVLIGCGGTGSEMLDELYRLNFTLRALGSPGLVVNAFDGDDVSVWNLGRQRFFPADVGMNKAKVLVERYVPYGATGWRYADRHFDLDQDVRFLEGADLLITAVDSAAFRYRLGEFAQRKLVVQGQKVKRSRKIETSALWLDMGNGNSDGQVILGHLGQGVQRIPNVFDFYGNHLKSLRGVADSQPSCSHEDAIASQEFGVNRQAARHGASLLWQLCRHGQLGHQGMFFDISTGESHPLKIDPQVWAGFGYLPEAAKEII